MNEKFKALGSKGEFNYTIPDKNLLELFKNPGVCTVTLVNKEFTSLCPITGQPDYSEIKISYMPKDWCIESKSLKLYFVGYRNYGAFTESLSQLIASDLYEALQCYLRVEVSSASRGGITITAICVKGGDL